MKKLAYIPAGYTENKFVIGQVKDACYSMETDWGDDTPIEQAIDETIDSFIPIYYSDLYESTPDMAPYIEQAVDEGMYSVEDKYFRLYKLIQAGWAIYLNDAIRQNMKAILVNFLLNIARADPRIPTDKYDVVRIAVEGLVGDDPDTCCTFGEYRKRYLDMMQIGGDK